MSLRAIWIPRRESGSSNCCLILTASFHYLVLVTHDERLAQRCDRIIKLVAGEIASDSDSSREERVVA